MTTRKILLLTTLLLFSFALVAPFVSAATASSLNPTSPEYAAQSNPELLSALKLHVAYLGESQQARMDGVIKYIDSISDMRGSYNLRMAEEDYMSTASSIPFMKTAAEIDTARDQMRAQTVIFSEETKNQMVIFNGSADAMKGTIAGSMRVVEQPFTNITEQLWLARDTARLGVFNTYVQQRDELLKQLGAQGVNTTAAQQIADSMKAQRAGLESALSAGQSGAIQGVNTKLREMNLQFRDIVASYQTNLRIQLAKQAILATPA